jgi:RNA polymerase sigma-70 factor (ECF subfamily)
LAKSDSRLIREYLHGEVASFGVLFERHSRSLEVFAGHLVGKPSDAEDLCQSAWLQAIRSLRSYQGRGTFRAWLHGIAFNICRDERRRPKLFTVALEPEHKEGDSANDPQLALERATGAERLRLALGTLEPAQRAVLILSKVQGFTYREIATILNCPIGTVRSRLHHAVRDLRAVLSSESAAGEIDHEVHGRSALPERRS